MTSRCLTRLLGIPLLPPMDTRVAVGCPAFNLLPHAILHGRTTQTDQQVTDSPLGFRERDPSATGRRSLSGVPLVGARRDVKPESLDESAPSRYDHRYYCESRLIESSILDCVRCDLVGGSVQR